MEQYHCLNCNEESPKGWNKTNKFCSPRCCGEYRKKVWLQENQERFREGLLPSRKAIKRYILIRDGNICSICKDPPEHNNKPLTMVLDHIDGNASNNMPSNFRLVCPNCDSQLPTYKGANRGNGRTTKGMAWYSRL